jgi:hypothetical protein
MSGESQPLLVLDHSRPTVVFKGRLMLCPSRCEGWGKIHASDPEHQQVADPVTYFKERYDWLGVTE